MDNIYLPIKAVAMDVDGTLTDGNLYIGEAGEVFKQFSAKDGYAVKNLLAQNNLKSLIITGRRSEIVLLRARELGISEVFQDVEDKLATLTNYAEKQGLSLAEIAYIGDDLNDLECIKACGFSACPCDAVDEVKNSADYISDHGGGNGAVRDFIEVIIRKNEAEKLFFDNFIKNWNTEWKENDFILLLPENDEEFNRELRQLFSEKLGGRKGLIVERADALAMIKMYSLYAFTNKLIIGSFRIPHGRKLYHLLETGIATREALLNDVLLGSM